MQVGDLVKYSYHKKVGTGIIVGFDDDDDPIVRDNRSGVVCASWRKKVEIIGDSAEVINESR